MRLTPVVLLLPAVIACSLAAWLGDQNRTLRTLLDESVRRQAGPQIGALVPPTTIYGIDGDSILIGKARTGGRQVLIAFTTTCSFCIAAVPFWQRLAQEASAHGHVQVVGLSLDSLEVTRRFAALNRLPFQVGLLGGNWPELYRLLAVPTLLVVDDEGRLSYARVGEVTDQVGLDSLMSALRPEARAAKESASQRAITVLMSLSQESQ